MQCLTEKQYVIFVRMYPNSFKIKVFEGLIYSKLNLGFVKYLNLSSKDECTLHLDFKND